MTVDGGAGAMVFVGFLKRLLLGEKKPIFLIPDELVWNNVKGRVGRSVLAGSIDLKKRVHSQMRWLQKNPEVVRNFFQEPNVATLSDYRL